MYVRSAHPFVSCLGVLIFISGAAASAADYPEPQGDLTLAQAVTAALLQNPELKSADYELQAAAARISQAKVRLNPEVDLALENFAGSGSAQGTSLLESTLSLSQVIELGGKRGRRVDVARFGQDAVTIERDARQLDVLAEVARRFIQVVANQEQVALTRRATELTEKTLTAITARVKAARSPEAEQSRARIALSRARLEEQRAEYEVQTSRRMLAAMWGSTGPVYGLAQADLYASPQVASFEALVERLRGNPDFLRFASESRLREAELRLAQAQATPNITLGAGVRHFQENADSALVFNFSVPLPVFDRNRGVIREAEARRDQVQANERAAYVRATTTLFELYQELELTRTQTQSLREEIIPQAEQALTQTESGYQRGRFSYLEMANAQQELIDLQHTAIEAAANHHRLAAEIERLTGESLAPAVQ